MSEFEAASDAPLALLYTMNNVIAPSCTTLHHQSLKRKKEKKHKRDLFNV